MKKRSCFWKKCAVAVCCAAFGIGALGASHVLAADGDRAFDEEKAQETALADAGVQEADAQRLRTKYEREDGEDFIEVEFSCDGMEYEYVIRTWDAMILQWSVEGRDVGSAAAELSLAAENGAGAQAGEERGAAAGGAQSGEIQDETADNAQTGEEQGAAAGGAQSDEIQDGTADNAQSGEEQGAPAGGAQAGEERGAAEGEAQAGDSGRTQSAAGGRIAADGTQLIGFEAAKDAVLQDSGIAPEDAVFTKIKFECGRRFYEYEIEVSEGRSEYEYTLDAQTGEILEAERD